MTFAAQVFAAAQRRPTDVITVVGAAGAGKSSTAVALAELAPAHDLIPILAAPARGAMDAGALVVASAVRRLGGRLQPSATWEETLETAEGLLQANAARVLVVCDEPSRWDLAGGYFGRRARDAVDLLVGPGASWRVVVLDQTSSGRGVMELPISPVADLRDGARWGELAEPASRVAERVPIPPFDTPFTQGLATAIEAWDPEGPSLPSNEPSELATRLAEVLVKRRHGLALWALWQRLAIARVAVDGVMLRTLGAARLTPLAQATLERVLLDGHGRLHEVLCRIAEERPVDPAIQDSTLTEAHDSLFEYHYERFRLLATEDDPDAGDHAAEALHHAAEVGDDERLDLVRVELSDQLNALGARLQHVHGRYASAGAVFFRATQINERDAFAHHGQARNYDIAGREVDTVDASYLRALSLEPRQSAWHAHRITYLADLGRLEVARRAWSIAESAVLDGGEHSSAYAELHSPVAATLLALGELEFAAYVLDGVPDWARDAEHRRLRTVLAGRLAAEEVGAFVPAPRSGRHWWDEAPQMLPQRDTEGRELVEWAAGRIEQVDDEGVHIHVAQVLATEERPVVGWTVVTPDAWGRRCLDQIPAEQLRVGTFVEIGRFGVGEDARTAIRLVPAAPLPEGRHQPLDPHRWISS